MPRAAEESSSLGACLVIGASGMIGRRLVAQLWQTVEVHGISKLVAADLHAPPSGVTSGA